jgi:DNA mismatch repair ATPase MutS
MDKELAVISYFTALLWSTDKLLKLEDGTPGGLFGELRGNYAVFKSLKANMSPMTLKSLGPVEFIAEYFKMIFLTDIRRYNRVMNKIYNESEAFHKLYKGFGEVDLAICVLSFRKSLKAFCRPSFEKAHSVAFKGIYHPLLDDAVTNDGLVARHSLITGPNASGKSTFIKAIAVNSILAQTIFTCTADEYTIAHSLVMTSMAVRDDIMAGDSYFITEIKSLKRVLDKIEQVPCTCFIDEILRGTNTIERIAASSAILKHLVGRDCLCMAASHDIELTKIMEGIYDNYHFSEKVESGGVSFDFKLKDGAANTKNAIRLLGFMGYDDAIVEAANKNVEEFLKTGSWTILG